MQIQIDASGHTHSVSGSQAPFHTACDGWKPIPAPVGSYEGHSNNIETQAGYSQVSQGQSQGTTAIITATTGADASANALGTTQYNNAHNVESNSNTITLGIAGGSSLNDLTDEQLVAVALQSGSFDGSDNSIQTEILPQALPSTGPAGEFTKHGLSSVEAQAVQVIYEREII